MRAMLREDHSGPCRDRTRETKLAGNGEFTCAGRSRIANWIGEMSRRLANMRFDHLPALREFMTNGGLPMFGEPRMGQSMDADGAERMTAESFNPGPIETQIVGQRGALQPGFVRKPADDIEQAFLRPGNEAPVKRIETLRFLGKGSRRQTNDLTVDLDFDP